MLVIYNLAPWLTMKRKYMLLTMVIPGPRQPGNDIDVFLDPLIDDLKILWYFGVQVWDARTGQRFMLHAAVLCTISDLPALGNLLGYKIKGYEACPVCLKETKSQWLKHSGKVVYLRHRRYLRQNHPYRVRRMAFDKTVELDGPTVIKSGEQVFDCIFNVQNHFGKRRDNPYWKKEFEGAWKKVNLMFTSFDYWKTLAVRNSIDVMHGEKNVCESLVGTLLGLKGKTKDGMKARMDLVDLDIRPKLHPVAHGSKSFLPPAAFTLSKEEKTSVLNWFKEVKLPTGYGSNVKSLVNMDGLKLNAMKSHDCHIMIQQLLPIAIRGVLPTPVRKAVTRLCFFFGQICKKAIDPADLEILDVEIAEVLCQLEMYFPPSFFDIMVHLCIHFVREIKELGPVYQHWMYGGERNMKTLKSYVRNRYRPEGCIVEGYIAEEMIEFCVDYLGDTSPIGIPETRLIDKHGPVSKVGSKYVKVPLKDRQVAHLYVLHHTSAVDPYVIIHMDEIKLQNPKRPQRWVQGEHNRTFCDWFKNHILHLSDEEFRRLPEQLHQLSDGPKQNLWKYQSFVAHGYTFYTKELDDRSVVQNSGVTLEANAMSECSARDRNPVNTNMAFYGIIQEIWDLDYGTFHVQVFKCTWVEPQDWKRDDMGFILADLSKAKDTSEPFILANQAQQVFYLRDPASPNLHVVLQGRRRLDQNANYEMQVENIEDTRPLADYATQGGNTQDEGNAAYAREDHADGEWAQNTQE